MRRRAPSRTLIRHLTTCLDERFEFFLHYRVIAPGWRSEIDKRIYWEFWLELILNWIASDKTPIRSHSMASWC
jgi:hypothetical protein